jgi:hypothetical protein
LFFESLYRESRGIFRAAFELWLDSIERVESGVLRIRHPLSPNFDPLLDQLSLADTLTLHAIAQHGSLTLEEVAEVFDAPLLECRMQFDRLLEQELIEEEPQRPGRRIRSQAARFVTDILRSRRLV